MRTTGAQLDVLWPTPYCVCTQQLAVDHRESSPSARRKASPEASDNLPAPVWPLHEGIRFSFSLYDPSGARFALCDPPCARFSLWAGFLEDTLSGLQRTTRKIGTCHFNSLRDSMPCPTQTSFVVCHIQHVQPAWTYIIPAPQRRTSELGLRPSNPGDDLTLALGTRVPLDILF